MNTTPYAEAGIAMSDTIDSLRQVAEQRLGQPIDEIKIEAKSTVHKFEWILFIWWYDRAHRMHSAYGKAESLSRAADEAISQIPQRPDLAAILGYDEVRS